MEIEPTILVVDDEPGARQSLEVILDNELFEVIQICSNFVDKDEIDPILRTFWKDILNTHFPEDYQNDPPDIDQWHDQFEDWIGIAGRPLFVG